MDASESCPRCGEPLLGAAKCECGGAEMSEISARAMEAARRIVEAHSENHEDPFGLALVAEPVIQAALDAEREEWRGKVEEFINDWATHKDECQAGEYHRFDKYPCTCGLDAARKELQL